MKLYAMGFDANNRSISDTLEVPLTKVSPTEEISAKQPGTIWRIGMRAFGNPVRTDKTYKSDSGPFEMHVGGSPHFIGLMAGQNEVTMQDGSVFRMGIGDFLYVRPGTLHHSNFPGQVPGIIFNLYTPGTDTDTQPLAIKS